MGRGELYSLYSDSDGGDAADRTGPLQKVNFAVYKFRKKQKYKNMLHIPGTKPPLAVVWRKDDTGKRRSRESTRHPRG